MNDDFQNRQQRRAAEHAAAKGDSVSQPSKEQQMPLTPERERVVMGMQLLQIIQPGDTAGDRIRDAIADSMVEWFRGGQGDNAANDNATAEDPDVLRRRSQGLE